MAYSLDFQYTLKTLKEEIDPKIEFGILKLICQ
jgi:hypothetical protein